MTSFLMFGLLELDLEEFVDGSINKYGKDGTLADMIVKFQCAFRNHGGE